MAGGLTRKRKPRRVAVIRMGDGRYIRGFAYPPAGEKPYGVDDADMVHVVCVADDGGFYVLIGGDLPYEWATRKNAESFASKLQEEMGAEVEMRDARV